MSEEKVDLKLSPEEWALLSEAMAFYIDMLKSPWAGREDQEEVVHELQEIMQNITSRALDVDNFDKLKELQEKGKL